MAMSLPLSPRSASQSLPARRRASKGSVGLGLRVWPLTSQVAFHMRAVDAVFRTRREESTRLSLLGKPPSSPLSVVFSRPQRFFGGLLAKVALAGSAQRMGVHGSFRGPQGHRVQSGRGKLPLPGDHSARRGFRVGFTDPRGLPPPSAFALHRGATPNGGRGEICLRPRGDAACP